MWTTWKRLGERPSIQDIKKLVTTLAAQRDSVLNVSIKSINSLVRQEDLDVSQVAFAQRGYHVISVITPYACIIYPAIETGIRYFSI